MHNPARTVQRCDVVNNSEDIVNNLANNLLLLPRGDNVFFD